VDALGHHLEVMDEGLHRLLHDVLDVPGGVPDAVGADLELSRVLSAGALSTV
jgi:hypothetical protein